MPEIIQKSTFEAGFIERTYSSIVTDMSVAFSELVANSWDAGATEVRITLPEKRGESIVIEDNGSGMTAQEFQNRWMVISYNRVAHQGEYIEFSTSAGKKRRIAYGRNGIGRHAMFCFDSQYQVETWRDGICNTYILKADGGESVLSVIEHTTTKKDGQGTRLTVNAIKSFPNASNVKRTLGYRFLFDPEFKVSVNGDVIESQSYISPIKTETIKLKKNHQITLSIYQIPDGEKSTSINGIAFWAGNRLIGNPSWTIGQIRVEDARRKFAQKHLIIVNADHLMNDVIYDWSELKRTEQVNEVYDAVISRVRAFRVEYYHGKIADVKSDVIRRNRDHIASLNIPALYDLKMFLEGYLEQKPEVDTEDLNLIVDSLVSVLNARNGLALLQKLSNMNTDDIDSLNTILSEWSVSDIREVLDEIDRRIKVIDAIEKLCSDPNTDELHTLHPLVSQARWLFGVEYDNPNFTFNRTLTTVLQEILQSQRKENVNVNWRKRPDLVFTDSFSLSSFCVDKIDENEMAIVDRILIIELKKGGFSIGRTEINQAEEYIDGIVQGNKLNCKPYVKAYIVGDSVKSGIGTHKKTEDYGEVFAYTYQQLVQTASKRLFNLRDKLRTHYQDISEKDYIAEILQEPQQTKMELLDKAN